MKTSKEILIDEALKQHYADYSLVFQLKGTKNRQEYKEKFSDIFNSLSIVKRVQLYEIDDSVFILFDKIKSSQRSWLRLANCLINCFKDIKGNAFVRIRLIKDVHINDDVLMSGTCIFDQFISNGCLFQKEILANLLWVL